MQFYQITYDFGRHGLGFRGFTFTLEFTIFHDYVIRYREHSISSSFLRKSFTIINEFIILQFNHF